MKKVVLVISISLVICVKAFSQQKRNWEDSFAIAFLQKNQSGDKIGIIKDTINGKSVTSKNYYCYESFRLRVSSTSSIYLINFGTFNTENSIYTAVVDEYNGMKKKFILGRNKYEEDLDELNNFFKSKSDLLKEEYKIEITDLFLRCRQGQRKTPKYFH